MGTKLMVDLNRGSSNNGRRIVTDLLERFDLVESAQKMVSTYSGVCAGSWTWQ
jgi:ABC-2 type transport system ATP-binding protein